MDKVTKVVTVVSLLAGLVLGTGAGWAVDIQPGEQAPDFTLTDLHGRPVALNSRRGKVVVLSFWATWCAKCRDEMKFLTDLADRYRDTAVVLGVSEEAEHFSDTDKGRIRDLVGRWGAGFPILLDEGQVVMDAYGVSVLPTSIVVDARGTVQSAEEYFYSEHEENMKFILELLAELTKDAPSPSGR